MRAEREWVGPISWDSYCGDCGVEYLHVGDSEESPEVWLVDTVYSAVMHHLELRAKATTDSPHYSVRITVEVEEVTPCPAP